MKIAGKKGFYRLKNLDRTRIKNGKEVIVKARWTRVYGEVAPEADDAYVPVIEEDKGLIMFKLKDLTLKAGTCAMVDLPGQRISFLRKDPDTDITRPGDQEQRLISGKYVEHPGRIGLDMTQVFIPIITKAGDRVKLRFDRFMFEEK